MVKLSATVVAVLMLTGCTLTQTTVTHTCFTLLDATKCAKILPTIKDCDDEEDNAEAFNTYKKVGDRSPHEHQKPFSPSPLFLCHSL